MGDPNMDAADNCFRIQELAWDDFTAWELWREENDLPVPADIGEAADMYARARETGDWPRPDKGE